ncbi:hypothetical protein P2318_32460 [Myxococcaceae bacterium GXIMD 01537]
MRARGWALLALVGAAGCVRETQLRPQPEAQVLPTNKAAAEATENGVRLIADGNSWRGSPSDLESSLTPVRVRLENHSGKPLRVQYSDFILEGASRFRYAAIPPLELNRKAQDEAAVSGTGGSGVEAGVPVNASYGWSSGWRVGVGYGWGWGWGWPGWYDPFWGSPYYPGPYPYPACSEPLPTRDMLKQALPEGVLENGGAVQGFLFFQGVGGREDAVSLRARLVDARDNEPFGSVSIPFTVTLR